MLHNVIIEQRLSGMVVCSVVSILVIISMGKRDCCFTLIVCRCHVIVSVLCLILTVKWGGLKCGVMKFPGHRPDALAVVKPTHAYLLDFFCSGI